MGVFFFTFWNYSRFGISAADPQTVRNLQNTWTYIKKKKFSLIILVSPQHMIMEEGWNPYSMGISLSFFCFFQFKFKKHSHCSTTNKWSVHLSLTPLRYGPPSRHSLWRFCIWSFLRTPLTFALTPTSEYHQFMAACLFVTILSPTIPQAV